MKKKILMIFLIVFIILSILGVVLSLKIKDKQTPNDIPKNDTNNQQVKINIDDEIRNIKNYSYLYYTLYDAPIIKSEDYVEIDGKKYYYFQNNDIKSLNDIDNLLNNLIVNEAREIRKSELFDKRDFKENNGKLYVYSEDNDGCKIDYDIMSQEYSYEEKEDGKKIVLKIGSKYSYHEFNLIKENNNYKVINSICDCNYNFN